MTARTMSLAKEDTLMQHLGGLLLSLYLELHLNNLLFDDEKVDYFKRGIENYLYRVFLRFLMKKVLTYVHLFFFFFNGR